MGTDIDLIVEVFSTENNKWHYVPDLHYNYRDYDLFGALAGVGHNHVPLISHLKGLPPDMSENTPDYFIKKQDTNHAHSWLSLKELQSVNWNPSSKNDSSYITLRSYQYSKDAINNSQLVNINDRKHNLVLTKEGADFFLENNFIDASSHDNVLVNIGVFKVNDDEDNENQIWNLFMDKLKTLHANTELIRIVFSFNN